MKINNKRVKRYQNQTLSRRLKKRYFNKVKLMGARGSLANVFLYYKHLHNFCLKEKLLLSKNIINILNITEVGTINVLVYWLKIYTLNNYK